MLGGLLVFVYGATGEILTLGVYQYIEFVGSGKRANYRYNHEPGN